MNMNDVRASRTELGEQIVESGMPLLSAEEVDQMIDDYKDVAMTVETNVKASKMAREGFDLLMDLCRESGLPPDGMRHFWLQVHKWSAQLAELPDHSELPKPRTVYEPKPMSDAEVAAFQEQEMEWGKHAGELVRDVPRDYFEWLVEQPNFHHELRRYLATVGNLDNLA